MKRSLTLLVLFATLSIATHAAQAAFGQQPPAAVANKVEHWAHLISLFVFAAAKTIWFAVTVVWLRRHHCRAFYRLTFATCGAILWLTGLWLGEPLPQLVGVVILCASHVTECLMHAAEEAHRTLRQPPPDSTKEPAHPRT